MVTLTWLRGLFLNRRGRLIATAAGVATAVALIASIGTFTASTASKMTTRAAATVPVDWQVEVQPGFNPNSVLSTVRSSPNVTKALPIAIAPTGGLSSKTGGTVQTTGSGKVLGLPPGYAKAFPGEIRTLNGSPNGVVLAQQTAANLHARPGDTIRIQRPGAGPVDLKVSGVVDLPAADSLFQRVGAPTGSQPQAPPDNVVLMPQSLFNRIEAPALNTNQVKTQIHTSLAHRLPANPSAAFTSVSGAARNLEVKLAGGGLVGDNLGVALDQARSDALYAQLLFLFLGIPGAALVASITVVATTAAADRRRREAALLRTRGASTGRLVRIAVGEAIATGIIGVIVGLLAARAIGSIAFNTGSFGAGTTTAIYWAAGASVIGLTVAAAAIAIPGWRYARALTVAGQRRQIERREGRPIWKRFGLDLIALAISGFIYWQASKNGYKLVLAPEGVPQISVNWYALLAPVLAWIGVGLLSYRLAEMFLARGRRPLKAALRPVADQLAPTVAATMSRQRNLIARGVAIVALAVAFAGSTSIFNSTYKQQAEVDARLSNGADVTVTQSPGAADGAGAATRLASVRGVKSIEPLTHRYAYVGADLQDIYGVRPQSIVGAGRLQNAWFQGGTAKQLMNRLGSQPDGVLVSEETVKDFQLHPGDLVRLRLQNGKTKQLKSVPFHYIGIAKEFPTAPRDSFLVANADYIHRATADPGVGTLLLQTDGTNPSVVASRVRSVVGSSAQVTDLVNQRKVIGSSLTAVELSGLTRLELSFALLLVVASTGLILALGFQERRRTFAIASALGAKSRHLGGFVWGESVFITALGLAFGVVIAAVLSRMLVKVLTGVFDPPPDKLAVPWSYLIAVIVLGCAATAIADIVTLRALRRPAVEELRDL